MMAKDYVDSFTALRDNGPAVIVKGSACVIRQQSE